MTFLHKKWILVFGLLLFLFGQANQFDLHSQNCMVINLEFPAPDSDVLKVCIGDPTFDLMQYANPAGGVFSGNGVTGNNFTPVTAGVGLHEVTYVIGVDSCQRFINVAAVDISFPAPTDNTLFLCSNEAPVDLTPYGGPPGGTFIGAGISNNIFTPNVAGPGTHPVQYVLGNDTCTKEIVIIGTNVQANITNLDQTAFCEGSAPIMLDGNGDPMFGAFYLNTISTGTLINGEIYDPALQDPGADTIIYVYLDFGSSCLSYDTVIVQVLEESNPEINLSETTFCQSADPVTLYGFPNGGSFSASDGVSLNENDLLNFSETGPGTHTLYYDYTDPLGACTGIDSMDILIDSGLNIIFTVIPSLCETVPDQIRYTGQPIADSITLTYEISDYEIAENQADSLLLVNWTYPGEYEVTMNIEGANCVARGNSPSFGVDERIKDDCFTNIFIPNAFTPNDDGVNDEFMVLGKGVLFFKMELYDRWGELVFETADMTQGWDGTFKDEKMNAGVFFYFAEIELVDGSKLVEKGNVTLIR